MNLLCVISKFSQKNKKRGISLLELVLVIAILSILTTISILHFTTVSTFGAGRDLHRMQDDLIYLRKYALRNRTKTKLVLIDNGYKLYLGDTEFKEVKLSDKLEFQPESNRTKFVFSETGRPVEAGTMIFNYGKTQKKIVVQPVNGRISLQEVENGTGF